MAWDVIDHHADIINECAQASVGNGVAEAAEKRVDGNDKEQKAEEIYQDMTNQNRNLAVATGQVVQTMADKDQEPNIEKAKGLNDNQVG